MNDIEREAIILNSAWKMIDGMVNWAIFIKNDLSEPTNLQFNNNECAQIFVILLGDFLSQITPSKKGIMPLDLKEVPSNSRPTDLTFLFHIRQVCASPKLGKDARALGREVEAFADWLEEGFVVPEGYLAYIEAEVDLQIERYKYLKMCGDITKHHLGRLSRNVRHIKDLLEKASGRVVREQDAYREVEHFYEWFFDHVFFCHSSKIAEFLNNIRWEIFRYLKSEFGRSYYLTDKATPDFHMYSYKIPANIREPIAQAMYWDAMNRVRKKLWFPRFVVDENCKQRY